MSLRHPSRTARRLLQLASLGLAGLVAGLLAGCNASNTVRVAHNDTDWQTSSTYASATASLSGAASAPHGHGCNTGPCGLHGSSVRTRTIHGRTM